MKIKKIASLIVTGAMLVMSFPPAQALAASLTTGSVLLSDSRPAQAATTYTVTFSGVSLSAIKCIKVQFSDAATGGSKPTGMTLTGALFSGTSNYIPTPASWTVTNDNVNGNTKLTFATGETPASATSRTVVLTTITNGSTAGTTYFVQFSTFNNTDCATSPVDNATIAYIYTNGQTVSATVDPTLSFTINSVASAASVNSATTTVTTTSTTIPLGTLSTGTNSIAAQDLVVGTNAQNGFTVTVKYTGSLASGSYNMTDHTGTNAAPTVFSGAGTEAFGYTTEDFTLGTGTAARFSANKWAALTTSPLELVYNAGPASLTTRVGYQAGISATTPSGSYTTTVVYVATPTY